MIPIPFILRDPREDWGNRYNVPLFTPYSLGNLLKLRLRRHFPSIMLSLILEDPMRPDQLYLKAAWVTTSLVSLAIAVGGYAWGKAMDCKPGQTDGQCGLNTFLGLFYGIGTGLALFLISTIFFLIIAYRRRSVSRQKSK